MRWLAAALAAWLLCGCSTVRMAYDNADTYLRWRAGNYLDVHGEQLDELDAAIGDFHRWHRAQALPQYARLALEAATRVEDGVSPEDLVWGYDSLLAQARIGLREAAQRIAPLLGRLDARQLSHIEIRLAEDNRSSAKSSCAAPRRRAASAAQSASSSDWRTGWGGSRRRRRRGSGNTPSARR